MQIDVGNVDVKVTKAKYEENKNSFLFFPDRSN